MSPYDADDLGPRITFAAIEPAVAAFADIDATHAAERNGAARILAVMMTYSDLGDRLRALAERIAAALADRDRDVWAGALEDAHHTLTALIGDPEPEPAPAVIVARVAYTRPGEPFDRIVIEHPDGRTETLDVPRTVTLPSGHVSRMGPHRLHVTLNAAGYHTVNPDRDRDRYAYEVKRVADQEGHTAP